MRDHNPAPGEKQPSASPYAGSSRQGYSRVTAHSELPDGLCIDAPLNLDLLWSGEPILCMMVVQEVLSNDRQFELGHGVPAKPNVHFKIARDCALRRATVQQPLVDPAKRRV